MIVDFRLLQEAYSVALYFLTQNLRLELKDGDKEFKNSLTNLFEDLFPYTNIWEVAEFIVGSISEGKYAGLPGDIERDVLKAIALFNEHKAKKEGFEESIDDDQNK